MNTALSFAARTAPAHGIILAGTQSSSGKTALTSLLLAAWTERKLLTQAFKVGPDFIDPAYHAQYTPGRSRNLDTWLMGQDAVLADIKKYGAGKISLVEGVMGLFDGGMATSSEGSTMELAELLAWPIILILPAAKAGRSLAATLRGFITEAGLDRIAGVILNQVRGDSHRDYLREALAPLKIPIFGALPECPELHWPERHLGLRAASESALPSRQELAALAEKHLDLTAILSLIIPAPLPPISSTDQPSPNRRIAVARDEAFHFYYADNLDYMRENGFELIEFSPLHDQHLPTHVQGLIFGGGFPEVFADNLAQNQSLRHEIKTALVNGLPIYAECGGLMYLAETLVDLTGKCHPMVGAIPGHVIMTSKLQNFGYCLAETPSENYRGHEFHHSRWEGEVTHANLWTVRRRRGGLTRTEGYRAHQLQASYVHLFWRHSPGLLRIFQSEISL